MSFSYYIIPIFIIVVFVYSFIKGNNAYDDFIIGVKDGMNTSINILPYLISMYIAVKVFDASGILDDIIRTTKISNKIIAQGFFRPFSSNASLSYMLQIFDEYGVDSREGMVSSILQGSTDTTLYVATLYFGSVGVSKYKYGIVVGLLSDLLCFIICIGMYFALFN